jgi:uncharacterized membrane protein YgcG
MIQKVILSYESYLNKEKNSVNEGWKTWIATFMMLLNLGVVPPNIQGAELQDKIEWAQSIPQKQIALAKFVSMLNSRGDLCPDIKDDKIEIQALLTRYNAQNKLSISMTELLNAVEVSSYNDDGGNTKYSWTMNTLSGDISLSGSFNKEKVQPATYQGGVSLVSDYGDFMTSDVEKQIHEALYNYEKITGVEIAILTIPTFGDEDPSEYSVSVFNRWGIGKKGGNNGILVVTSMGDRKYWITTGYGMEDMFTDAKCRRFGERYLASNFKEGEYEKGFQELIQAMKAEFGNTPIERTKELAKKAEIEREQKAMNFLTSVLEFLGLAAVLGLLGYLVYVGIEKRKKLSERIDIVKKNISRFDKDINLLIDNGDPIFNDDEILAQLKAVNDKLKAKKLRGNKTIDSISTELNSIITELNEIKKIERNIRSMQMEINKINSQMASLKTQSKDLQNAIELVKKVTGSVNFDKIDISDNSFKHYTKMFDTVRAAYANFNNVNMNISKVEHQLTDVEQIRKSIKDKIDIAKVNADMVKDMGYPAQVDVSEEDINALLNLMNAANDIYKTDIQQALAILSDYQNKSSDINLKLDEPVKKYNDIISAKKSIDEADKLIKPRMVDIKNLIQSGYLNNNDRKTALELVDKFDEKRGIHKHTPTDPFGEDDYGDGIAMSEVLFIFGLLTKLCSSLDEIINKGLKKKEDEEERERREEEEREEEERSNSYSSGSTSSGDFGGGSSSEDFGGFGGGMSGGGGGGGSW